MGVFGYIVVALVLFAFAYVLWSAKLQGSRQRRWPSVEGVITQSQDHRPRGNRARFDIEVRFRTLEGRDVSAWAANPVDVTGSREAGTAATVSYDPNEPRRFYVQLPGMKKASPWAQLLAVGVVLFVAGVFYLVFFA